MLPVSPQISEPNVDLSVTVKDVVGPVGFIKFGAGRIVAVLATVVELNAAELQLIAAQQADAARSTEGSRLGGRLGTSH
jgi:hypothetical protein